MNQVLFYMLALLLLPIAYVRAQATGQQEIQIVRISEKINPDGVLHEAIWQTAERIGDFRVRYPVDTGYAQAPTEVMMAYDDNYIYVAAICYRSSHEAPYVAESLRRDFNFGKNDNLSLYLDPFNGELNGFMFGVTPYGVQREGLIANTDNVSTFWDNKWYSGAEIYTDYYVVEMVIPFSTIRYSEENKVWRVNFVRNDLATNEHTTWMPIPRPHGLSSLAFAGKLIWNESPPKPAVNISLIPYMAANGFQDQSIERGKTQSNLQFGADLKVGISPSLNLDVTIMPDFSQANADAQVINLSRFNIGLPEQRQFFLENSDIFDRYGFSRIRPFFSRRVGEHSSVLAGARLSGQPAAGWRAGVLMAQTDNTIQTNIENGEQVYTPGQNYLVTAAQRQLGGRSSLGMILVNRQAIGLAAPDSTSFLIKEDYNRVVGVDYNLASKNNKWTGKTFLHTSVNPDKRGIAHATYLGYRTPAMYLAWNHEYVSADYRVEAGFLPRSDYYRLEPYGELSFYPKRGPINRHSPKLKTDLYFNSAGQLTDRANALGYEANFTSTAQVQAWVTDQYVELRNNFNPTNTPDTALMKGSSYRWQNLYLRYTSDQRKAFNWSVSAEGGGYYNGKLTSLSGNLGWRIQHLVQLNLKASYNRINLPAPYADAKYFLIGPKVDFTFTDKIFLTTFVQYNNQQNNLGLNTRLQWRFKPVSDVFLVYTDQYTVDSQSQPQLLGAKYRALVLKLSYWINV